MRRLIAIAVLACALFQTAISIEYITIGLFERGSEGWSAEPEIVRLVIASEIVYLSLALMVVFSALLTLWRGVPFPLRSIIAAGTIAALYLFAHLRGSACHWIFTQFREYGDHMGLVPFTCVAIVMFGLAISLRIRSFQWR